MLRRIRYFRRFRPLREEMEAHIALAADEFEAQGMSRREVYGVISFSVARRTNEIGIRMALGAARGQVVRMVLWEGLQLALIGVAIGMLGGIGFGKVARSLLYGVSASDPATFVTVPLFLLLVAAVATILPARRAVNTSPTAALRND